MFLKVCIKQFGTFDNNRFAGFNAAKTLSNLTIQPLVKPLVKNLTPIVIAGPTASGKSRFALDLALALKHFARCEIINADAFCLYKGMDIGTAKPSLEERKGIAHHLFDILDISQTASVWIYRDAARATINKLRQNGVLPIIAGGSAFYLYNLLYDMQIPPHNNAIRQKIENDYKKNGKDYIFDMLKKYDPISALNITDIRRAIRALEVYKITQKPFSSFLPNGAPQKWMPFIAFYIESHIATLQNNIMIRSQNMLKNGFLDEIGNLLNRGFLETKTASKAVGYLTAAKAYKGQISLEKAAEDISLETMRLAKKQIKFFESRFAFDCYII